MLESKPKSKRRPFNYKKKEILSRGRNQAKLAIPKGKEARTASPLTVRRRTQGESIADFGKAIATVYFPVAGISIFERSNISSLSISFIFK